MQELISVIIPVYKVEAFLERCVRSVLAQTYENLEIILVDDGSPDRSGEICDQLAKEDTRITVYHKVNGGLSDARNYGTVRSNGDYVTFIDSDDYIAPNYIEYLLGLIKKNEADTSCCGMVMTEEDTADYKPNSTLPEVQVLTGVETCKELCERLYTILVTACGKLYKSEIAKKHLFPVGRKHEDEATTCKFYYESSKVAIGNQCLYAYYQNPQSITHTKGTAINADAIWALGHRADFFEGCGEKELAKKFRGTLVRYCIKDSLNNSGRCNEILKEIAQKELSIRSRLVISIYNFSPVLYRELLNIKTWLGKRS